MSDIDLLMILAALTSGMGASFKGAVLLTLFSLFGTLEKRALGCAHRAIEALLAVP